MSGDDSLMNTKINPHGIAAIVQQGEDVEVRYSDGKEPVLLTNTTTTKVLVDVQKMKMRADNGR
jgi:hypothetical protein